MLYQIASEVSSFASFGCRWLRETPLHAVDAVLWTCMLLPGSLLEVPQPRLCNIFLLPSTVNGVALHRDRLGLIQEDLRSCSSRTLLDEWHHKDGFLV